MTNLQLTDTVCFGAGAQEHWKSLKTDQFLQVQGTGGTILAMGDAATVAQVCHMYTVCVCSAALKSMLGRTVIWQEAHMMGMCQQQLMGVCQQLRLCCSQKCESSGVSCA